MHFHWERMSASAGSVICNSIDVRFEREADIECKRTARPAFILNTDLSTTAELLSYRSLRKIPSHRLHLPVIFEEARDQYQHRTVRARQHSQKRL